MKLTIGITTFEEDVFLEELLFVLRQELIGGNLSEKVEIIITNDLGNNRKTREILEANKDFCELVYYDKSHNTPAVGRNQIINLAKGEYILFMDGDDNFITPISGLVEELTEIKDKDVLVSEVVKITNDGIQQESPFIYTNKLFNCSDAEFKENYYKYVVHQTGIWSIYRTEFLRENNLYYPLGKRYEDNLLMTNLILNPQTRYGRVKTKYYGWRTNLASFSNADKNHVIENRLYLYEETLRKIAENQNHFAAPYVLFSVWNQTYSNILRNYPVLSQSQYRKYFKALNKITTKNQKLIKSIKEKADGDIDFYYRLRNYPLTDSYLIVRSIQLLHNVKKKKTAIKKQLLKLLTLLPINNNKIFLTSQYGEYNDNSKYFYLQLKANPQYKDKKFIFAVKDKTLLTNSDFIDFNNKWLYYFHHYTAKEIYFNTWYDPELKKRKQQVWTQLWHGIPYKKVYKDIETFEQTTVPYKIKNKERSIANWDYVWSVNKYNTNIFQKLFPNSEIIEKEYPKTEWLIENQTNQQLIIDLKEKYNLDLNKKYVVYAPTYRPYMLKINLEEVKKYVPEGYQLLLHLHPLIKVSSIDGEAIILKDVADVQEIILITDAVITDYSSIAYDYHQTNKEVILYQPDYQLYRHIHGLYEGEKYEGNITSSQFSKS